MERKWKRKEQERNGQGHRNGKEQGNDKEEFLASNKDDNDGFYEPLQDKDVVMTTKINNNISPGKER